MRGFCGVFCLGVFGMDFFSVMPEEKSFPAAFVVVLTVTGTCVGECPHPPF